MKKITFIAALAFATLLTESANANTIRTENAETIIQRTETPSLILGEDMLKITITIHFKKWDLTIEIECLSAGGGGNTNNGPIELDGTLEGDMLKFQLPESLRGNLEGATNFRITKGGSFKLPNGEIVTIKSGQTLSGNGSFIKPLATNALKTKHDTAKNSIQNIR